MERFTERDIDLWRQWMEGENTYTQRCVDPQGKFTVEQQAGYISEGILRGKPSFGGGANGRLGRYLSMQPLLEGAPDKFEKVRLKVVRDLGKSAHNHYIALVFTSHAHPRGPRSTTAIDLLLPGVLDDLAQDLTRRRADDNLLDRFLCMDPTLGEQNIEAFRLMQFLQDRNRSDLADILFVETSRIHAGFIAVANQYGWPEPGVNSTLDAEPWAEAAL